MFSDLSRFSYYPRASARVGACGSLAECLTATRRCKAALKIGELVSDGIRPTKILPGTASGSPSRALVPDNETRQRHAGKFSVDTLEAQVEAVDALAPCATDKIQ
jgi:hypothetical protein